MRRLSKYEAQRSNAKFIIVLVALWLGIGMAALATPPTEKLRSCGQLLEEAQEAFSKGNLLQVLELAQSGCHEKFTTDEHTRESWWRLLAETHLLLDENKRAEECMKKLFRLNEDYSADTLKDSRKYQQLVAKHQPVYLGNLAFQAGVNQSQQWAMRQGEANAWGQLQDGWWNNQPGFQGQVGIQRPFGVKRRWASTAGLGYALQRYQATQEAEDKTSVADYRESQHLLQLHMGLRWYGKGATHKDWQPYAGAGLTAQHLLALDLKARSQLLPREGGEIEFTELLFDNKMKLPARLQLSPWVEGGLQYRRSGAHLFTFGLRLQATLTPQQNSSALVSLPSANGEVSTKEELNQTFGYKDPRFHLTGMSFTIGYARAFYLHK